MTTPILSRCSVCLGWRPCGCPADEPAPTINLLTRKPCGYCAGTGLDKRAMAYDRAVKEFLTNLRLVDRPCPYCVPAEAAKEVA